MRKKNTQKIRKDSLRKTCYGHIAYIGKQYIGGVSHPPLQTSPKHHGPSHPASALTFAFWRKKKNDDGNSQGVLIPYNLVAIWLLLHGTSQPSSCTLGYSNPEQLQIPLAENSKSENCVHHPIKNLPLVRILVMLLAVGIAKLLPWLK